MVNLVMALGQSCRVKRTRTRVASYRTAATAGFRGRQDGPASPEPDAGAEPAADADVPGFARTRPRKPLWRDPIVSSFLAATGSLLLLHYL